MATQGNGGNKPDLSDLKARLGLTPTTKKGPHGPPGAHAPPPGAGAGPPGASGPPGTAPPGAPPRQQASTAPQPSLQAPPSAGHPQPSGVTSVGGGDAFGATPSVQSYSEPEPVQARAQSEPQQVSRHTGPPPGARPPSRRANLENLPVHHVDIDESVTESSIFSPKFLAVMAFMLFVGLAFGYLATKASQAREVYTNQTESAKIVLERVEPKIEASKDVAKKVASLDPTSPNFEAASALAAMEFAPEPGVLGAGAAYVGGDNVYNVTEFQGKALAFKQLLTRHDYMTNKVDKEELEQLVQGNELLQGNKNFAVRYNYKQLVNHLKDQGDDKTYKPLPGSLVLIDEFKVDDDGQVGYQSLSNNQKGTESVRGIIPIEKTEIFKTGGQNALQRYERRVKVLKYYAQDLEKATTGIVDGLGELAHRGEAPLLQLSIPEPEAETAPTPPSE